MGNNYTLLTGNKGHPRADNRGRVAEHILIAEHALGKFISKPNIVHHIDCDHLNNVNSNFVICENEIYHKLLHVRTRALKTVGKPNARRCKWCHGWDLIEKDYMKEQSPGHWYHHECKRIHQLNRRKRGNGDFN